MESVAGPMQLAAIEHMTPPDVTIAGGQLVPGERALEAASGTIAAHAADRFFRAIAVDYDFTLTNGGVSTTGLAAVDQARRDGLKVVLVTGRILRELRAELPEVDSHFDAIVAENGGVLAIAGSERALAQPVDVELEQALAARGVPVRRGSVLLACDALHDRTVLEESARLGLEVQLVHNRAALMVLPSGISKGTGVHHALGMLGVSFHNTIGVGDGENDHSLLDGCEVGVAVANAVESLRRHADLVLEAPDGEGIAQLFAQVRRNGLRLHPRRWQIELGVTGSGERIFLPASQINVLISGESGYGKSYLAGLIAERLLDMRYSICVLDPEGDHVAIGHEHGVMVVDAREYSAAVLPAALGHRFGSAIVDLSQLCAEDKRRYMHEALAALAKLRAETGVPHWVFLDEAHDPIGARDLAETHLAGAQRGYCLVTYRPEALPPTFRSAIDVELSLVERAGVATHADAMHSARRFTVDVRRAVHVRHWHKYTHAQLPPLQRFVFRGDGRGADRSAGNLEEFQRELSRAAAAVVSHHVTQGDFSRWVAQSLQDTKLANELSDIEAVGRGGRDTHDVRAMILAAIVRRYGALPG